MKTYAITHSDGFGNETNVVFEECGSVLSHDHRNPDWPDHVRMDLLKELFEDALENGPDEEVVSA